MSVAVRDVFVYFSTQQSFIIRPMFNLDEVGAVSALNAAGQFQVDFGLYLPGILPSDGYDVLVRIIHRDDRFDPTISPQDFPLAHQPGSPLDLWTTTVLLNPVVGTRFGQPGTYLYRYQLLQSLPGQPPSHIVTQWFTDPVAFATDVGELSAFDTPGLTPAFPWTDAAWKTPALDDLIVYELQVEEFNGTFDGVIERLTYLASLGVNAIELMPVTSPKLDFDWGYGPLHYFAPNARTGGVAGLKRLVNACHAAGIAVILDVVYQHVDSDFPYHRVYADSARPSPMIGSVGPFGPQADFTKTFTQDYFHAANLRWLQEYHIDGFRYDEVADYYFYPTDTAYAKLAYDTYQDSLNMARFQGPPGTPAYSRLIQVAEDLSDPRGILRNTYTNATWQNELLGKAEDMASNHYVDDAFAHLLNPTFSGYPATKTVNDLAGNPVEMPVAPFQYLESHDHSQLISFMGQTQDFPGDVPFGDRSKFYKVQPFAIALYTCQGVPMLWQGQEFAESWTLPNGGRQRISFLRNVHWEYFYDEDGSPLVRLYRILGVLRRGCRALRGRQSYYFYQQSRPGDGLIAYSRRADATATDPAQVAMVFLNFSDADGDLTVPFPLAGVYREMIDDGQRQSLGQPPLEITVAAAGDTARVHVSSNYGGIFIKA